MTGKEDLTQPMTLRWLGRLLKGVRAGEKHALASHTVLSQTPQSIEMSSQQFLNGGSMATSSAGIGVGENLSPQLSWLGAPPGVVEFALVMEDLDVPLPRPLIHMIVTGIPPDCTRLPEGALSSKDLLSLKGDIGARTYRGPRPIPGHGPHRYQFYVLALHRQTKFQSPPRLKYFIKKISGSVLAYGKLLGTYERF